MGAFLGWMSEAGFAQGSRSVEDHLLADARDAVDASSSGSRRTQKKHSRFPYLVGFRPESHRREQERILSSIRLDTIEAGLSGFLFPSQKMAVPRRPIVACHKL